MRDTNYKTSGRKNISVKKMKTLQLKFPTSGKKSTMIVEAGHIYTNEQPALEHQVGATWGNLLSSYLMLFGAETAKWLFIDNYNPSIEGKPQILDETRYVEKLTTWGFVPDKIVYEADLVSEAKEVVKHLQQQGYAGPHHNGRIVLYKGNVLLHDPQSDKYMCALLDACLYMQKLKQADGCITVLDQQYATQQKGTITILKRMGVGTDSIFPFFYSTTQAQQHASVESSRVYVNASNGLSFVQPAIDLLQAVAKLSGSIIPTPTLEMQVAAYGI